MLLIAGAAAALLLLMPAALGAFPLLILSQMLIYAIACLGLNLLYGTAGSLSLGHAAYFGVAAYAGAFLYRFYFVDSLELYLLCGVAISTALAAAVGYLCARSTRVFFAILTLAFGMVVHSLFIDGAVFMLFGGFGWALYLLGEGSMYIPRFPILGVEYSPQDFASAFYKVIVAAFVLTALVLWRIGASPFGQALRAIRENETRAAFIGIPVWQYRWHAFIISGFFVAFAGGLYGQLARQITPDQLHWLFSAQLIVAIVLGGSRHFLGPVLGAFAFVWLEELTARWAFGRYALFGLLLILVLFFFQGGMAGGLARLLDKVRKEPG
ncbi:MAG: branched-chain amino acid ABC transporter permease [Bradyrhizobiaceae bacterium]|nr:branched-chain amino acid ABC transporter permease [Bradyrhizobiaceae bacterium]